MTLHSCSWSTLFLIPWVVIVVAPLKLDVALLSSVGLTSYVAGTGSLFVMGSYFSSICVDDIDSVAVAVGCSYCDVLQAVFIQL